MECVTGRSDARNCPSTRENEKNNMKNKRIELQETSSLTSLWCPPAEKDWDIQPCVVSKHNLKMHGSSEVLCR